MAKSVLKAFDDLTFTDDFMFGAVLQNKQICIGILNLILAGQVDTIVDIEYQRSFLDGYAKGVRFDVLVKTADGKIYDIEMQTTSAINIPKRMRFYQAAVDNSFLNQVWITTTCPKLL